jgi:hypothetical protein
MLALYRRLRAIFDALGSYLNRGEEFPMQIQVQRPFDHAGFSKFQVVTFLRSFPISAVQLGSIELVIARFDDDEI